MAYDPNLPAPNSPNSSAEMRAQLQGLKALIDAILTITAAQIDGVTTLPPGSAAGATLNVVGNTLHFTFSIPEGAPGEVTLAQLTSAIAGTSNNSNGVATLGMSADFNYSQIQMQALCDKLDELINALRR